MSKHLLRIHAAQAAFIDLTIRPRRLTKTGMLYDVFRDGVYLLTSRDPNCEACRALLALGIVGTVRFGRDGRAEHDLSMDIERGAGWSASEGVTQAVRLLRYKPLVAWQDG